MNRAEKNAAIARLREDLDRAQGLILAEFRGLSVEADTRLRNEFRSSGCKYRVVKNALAVKALAGTGHEKIASLLVGPTAIAYSFEDTSISARVAARIAKQEERFVIKGGLVDGAVIDGSGVEALAALPGRDEVRAMFLAALVAGPGAFLGLLRAAPLKFLHLTAARSSAAESGS